MEYQKKRSDIFEYVESLPLREAIALEWVLLPMPSWMSLIISNCLCFSIITTRLLLQRNWPFSIEKFLQARLKFDLTSQSVIDFGTSLNLIKTSISSILYISL